MYKPGALLLIIWLLPVFLSGQTSHDTCRRVYAVADSLAAAPTPNYELALKKLEAAKLCDPDLTPKANELIVRIYKKINGLRQQAEEALAKERVALAEAQRQARISEAGRLAATVQENCLIHPAATLTNTRMAIEAIQLDPTVQTDRALRTVLKGFPALEAEIQIGLDPRCVATDTAHTLLAVGGFWAIKKDKLCLVDVQKREIRSSVTFPIDLKQLAISGDGRYLADGLSDYLGQDRGIVEVRDTKDLSKRYEIRTRSYVGDLAFSPDGKYLAVDGWEGSVYIYQVENDSLVATLPFPQPEGRYLSHLAFDARGQYLVGSSYSSFVVWRDWQTTTAKPMIARIADGYGLSVAFSSEGEYLGVSSHDSLCLFDLVDLSLVRTWKIPELAGLWPGKEPETFLTYARGGRVQLWSRRSDTATRSLNIHPGEPMTHELILTRNGDYLFAARTDDGSLASSAVIWDTREGLAVGRMFHEALLRTAIPLDQGTAAVTLGSDDRIRWWRDVANSEMRLTSKQYIFDFTIDAGQTKIAAAFSRNGSSFGNTTDVRIYDLNHPPGNIDIPNGAHVLALSYLAGSKDLLLATSDGLQRCDPAKGTAAACQMIYTLDIPRRQAPVRVSAAAFSPDGKMAMFCTNEGRVFVLRAPNWDKPQVIPFTNPMEQFRNMLEPWSDGMTVSASGSYVAVGITGCVVVLDTKKGRQVQNIPQDYRISDLRFTADEREIVLGSGLRPVEDYKNPQPAIMVFSIGHPERKPRMMRLSGDGTPHIAVSRDRKVASAKGSVVQLWQLPDEKDTAFRLLAQLDNERPVTHAQFTNDGKQLITCSGQDIRSFLLRPEDLIAEARQRMGPAR